MGGALAVAVLPADIKALRYIVLCLHAAVYSFAASRAPGWQGKELLAARQKVTELETELDDLPVQGS